MPTYTVLFCDPKRDRGGRPENTLHAPGCADVDRALNRTATAKSPASTCDYEADTPEDAAAMCEAEELGAVDIAPCARRT